jgi:4-hydroxybenzoate polyprenyltransferase
MTGRMGLAMAFLRTSRANLLVGSLGHAMLGLLLGATTIDSLFSPIVVAYVMMHYSIAFVACNVNCLYDYDVDRLHKRYMSDAVDALGTQKLKVIIIWWLTVAVILISYFAFEGLLLTTMAAIFGLVAALTYSVEPVRIKRRGKFSQLPIFLGLYVMPILGGWFVFRTDATLTLVMFVVGYALMNEGFTIVNMVEDYSEDKEKDIYTWAHTFGVGKCMKAAYVFSLSGVLCILAMLLSFPIPLTRDIQFLTILLSLVSLFLILLAASEVRQVGRASDAKRCAKRYGPSLQRWFIMTRYPLMFTALSFLLLN